jgi:dihydropteroate synthase
VASSLGHKAPKQVQAAISVRVAADLRQLETHLAQRDCKVYLQPFGLTRLPPASGAGGFALALAGGPSAFTAVRLRVRRGKRTLPSIDLSAEALREWIERQGPAVDLRIKRQLENLQAPRAEIAGLAFAQPRLMAVLNVTPDSFSDGGDFAEPDRAIARGVELIGAGADVIDVGGESTRPGAAPVSAVEERRRVMPIVAELAPRICVSIDTRRAATMREGVALGARLVNDVSALRHDGESLATIASLQVPAVLMHMQKTPETMQIAPAYDDPLLDVFDFLEARIAACEARGIGRERLIVDPGIGFGKSLAHNLTLLNGLALLHALGTVVALGISRKSVLGRLTGISEPKGRLPESLAGALWALAQGVQMLRVHDVAETRRAVAVWQSLAGP